MQLAFSRPTATPAEWHALVQGFRPAGFTGVQLKPAQYSAYLDNPQQLVREWPQLQNAISGLITYGCFNDEGRAMLRRAFRFAAAVHADRVIYCQADSRDGLTPAVLQQTAREMADLGKEAIHLGTKLTIHNHYGQPLMQPDELATFYEAVPDGTVGLTIDTAHLVKSGVTDVAGVIRDFASVIDNYHIKDYADGQFKVLGEGTIDFAPIFNAIRATGYDGWVSTDEESGGEISTTLGTCYTVMARGLQLV